MAFFDDLATNATKHGVKIIIYSGNDDSIVAHRGSESTYFLTYCMLPSVFPLTRSSYASNYTECDIWGYTRLCKETQYEMDQ